MATETQTSKETYWSQDYVDMSRVLRQPMQFAVKLLWPVYEIANLEPELLQQHLQQLYRYSGVHCLFFAK